MTSASTLLLVGWLALSSVLACTGGAGDLPGEAQDAGASSSSSSSSSSSGSGGSTDPIRASDFSQSCVTAEDCSPVFEGQICTPCGCPNAAIAKSELSSYQSERDAAKCATTDVACAPCQAPILVCANGTCAIQR